MPPSRNSTPALIVCERRQTWAIAWRRALRDQPLPLVETRTLDDCTAELRARPGSFAAVEVTSENLERVAARLELWRRELPHSAAMILGDREWAAAEFVLRAAGAVHAEFSPRNLQRLIPLLQRHFALAPPTPAADPLDLLPW